MPFLDPAEKAAVRLEVRRFVARCEGNEGLVQRADTLRELARLATTAIPYKIANEPEARDAQWRVATAADDRAKELVLDQIAAFAKADEEHRAAIRSKMLEDWGNLTGPLSHLRTWANGKLTGAEQML